MHDDFNVGDIVRTAWDEIGIITEDHGYDEEEEADKFLFYCFREQIEYYMYANHLFKV